MAKLVLILKFTLLSKKTNHFSYLPGTGIYYPAVKTRIQNFPFCIIFFPIFALLFVPTNKISI